MKGVQSRHGPGVVAIIMGDLARYTTAMRSIESLCTPPKSCGFWESTNNVANGINKAFTLTLDSPLMEWCWLMGDDHLFPESTLINLLDRDVDVVVPLCLNRYPPFDCTILQGGGIKSLNDLPPDGLYELQDDETCGDAGLLIRRHVLEKIEPPWYDRLRSGSLGVDDQVFVNRVRQAGFKVQVDLDHPIGHTTPFTMLPIRKRDRWEVRLICGGKHAADLVPKMEAQ